MTAARFLLRCCSLVAVLSFCTIYATSLQYNVERLRGASKVAVTEETTALQQPRRLRHDRDNEDTKREPDSLSIDKRPVISTEFVDNKTEELTLDSSKAEEALEELVEEEKALKEETPVPTAAPHHSHNDDKKKDKKKENDAPTPAAQDAPAPTTKTEQRASPSADDTTPTDAGSDTDTTEKGGTDTAKGGGNENEEDHQEEDFNDEPTVPTEEHTKKPTKTEETEKDEIQAVDDDLVTRDDDVLKEELHEEQTEAKVFGGFGFLIAIVAMIFTAHQMSENPDGIYASVCRLAITIVSCVVKAILMPFRSIFGSRYHAGHMQLSTTDPYRSHAMELT